MNEQINNWKYKYLISAKWSEKLGLLKNKISQQVKINSLNPNLKYKSKRKKRNPSKRNPKNIKKVLTPSKELKEVSTRKYSYCRPSEKNKIGLLLYWAYLIFYLDNRIKVSREDLNNSLMHVL